MDDTSKHALMEAYVAQRPALRRFLCARLGNEQTADDILQDMYLKLDRAAIEAPVDNLNAFLYRTANNLVLDHRKAAARRRVRDQGWSDTQVTMAGDDAVSDTPDTDEALDAKKKIRQVLDALEELPPQCRTVFKACKFEGLTYREASERHGVSVGTIEKHVSKALKHLIKHLGSYGDDPG